MSAIDNFKNIVYNTPASPLIDVLLNGSVVDLIDAAHRAENPRVCRVWAWIDSSVAHLSTALLSVFRLVHDLAMALIFALAWPFSVSARKTCKVHLFRSAIDFVGVVGGCAGVFYPPTGMKLLSFVLEKISRLDIGLNKAPEETQEGIAIVLEKIYNRLNADHWGAKDNPVKKWSEKIF